MNINAIRQFGEIETLLGGHPMPASLCIGIVQFCGVPMIPQNLKQEAEEWIRRRLQFQHDFCDTGVPGVYETDSLFLVECRTEEIFEFLQECGFIPFEKTLDEYQQSDRSEEILVCHDVPLYA